MFSWKTKKLLNDPKLVYSGVCNTYYRHVGQRNVLWDPPDPYGEVGFEAWLIETRKCHPSTRGLKMS